MIEQVKYDEPDWKTSSSHRKAIVLRAPATPLSMNAKETCRGFRNCVE